MQLDLVVTSELDRAQLEDARTGGCHLQHLLVTDGVQLACVRHDAWVGCVNAVHVGVDLARVGAESGGERDGRRVRAAAAERRDVVVGRDPLEAGDEHDPLRVECLVDAARANVDDLRLAVGGVGDDPRLRPRQRDRLVTEVVDRHRTQRAGDALADGDQHVELARLRLRRDLVREPDEVVGRVAHRREHRHDPVSGLACRHEPLPDSLQALDVGDRGPAELHDDRAGALAVSSAARAGSASYSVVAMNGSLGRLTTSPYGRSEPVPGSLRRRTRDLLRRAGHWRAELPEPVRVAGRRGRRPSPLRSCSDSSRARPP